MTLSRPLIMHVVYSFDVGGLENGVVNIINNLDPALFRHVVVEFIDMDKPPGHGMKLYPKLYRLMKDLKPSIVHTRNLAALEAVIPAFFAGVPVRVHGEHGWDVSDPHGTRLKYKVIRRIYSPFVSRYVALSSQIERYLHEGVGVQASRIARICNGVDTQRFQPRGEDRGLLEGSPFNMSNLTVLGTVGRLQAVKDQSNLLQAFALLLQWAPGQARRLRLMIVGDGPLRKNLEAQVARLGLDAHVWFAGARNDIPAVMRAMDVFVLPSRAEGISNTILEAMASELPVVATDVGGARELVEDGGNGRLVRACDSEALANAFMYYLERPARVRKHGLASRDRALARFSIKSMVAAYSNLYTGLLAQKGVRVLEAEADGAR